MSAPVSPQASAARPGTLVQTPGVATSLPLEEFCQGLVP
jgi:hypothetical protein